VWLLWVREFLWFVLDAGSSAQLRAMRPLLLVPARTAEFLCEDLAVQQCAYAEWIRVPAAHC